MASENLNQSSVALTPVEATDYAESVAAYKAQKRPFLSFLSGISAGACIALAFVFYTTTQTASAGSALGINQVSWWISLLLGRNYGGDFRFRIIHLFYFNLSCPCRRKNNHNPNDSKLDCSIFGQLHRRFIYCCGDLVWRTNHGSKWSMGFNHFGNRST